MSASHNLSDFNSKSFSLEHARPPEITPLVDAIIDLYLNVKIRNSDEIDDYDSNKLVEEKKELESKDPIVIVDYIKQSIEILLSLKLEEEEEKKGY